MYKNLRYAMTVKNVTTKQMSELLDISEKTAFNKIHGKTEWTYKEVFKLRQFMFPEYDVDWLFSKDVA